MSKTPTELAIYKDNLCICIQADPTGSDVRQIWLADGEISVLGQVGISKQMQRVIFGEGFFLHNNPDGSIRLWELGSDGKSFVKLQQSGV